MPDVVNQVFNAQDLIDFGGELSGQHSRLDSVVHYPGT